MSDNPKPWLSSQTCRRLLVAVLIIGTALRLVGVHRPLDHRLTSPWRESDATQIARNFHREGMNILYPRVDWRGDTPGFVEMEFPLLAWVTGGLYHIFGEHVQIYRLLTSRMQIACLLLFALLARRMLPPTPALFATTLYAFNQTLIELSITLQPEPLMLLLILGAAHMLWTWNQKAAGKFKWLYGCCLLTGAAILAKATAIHFGFLIAFILLRKLSWRSLRNPRVYLAAGIALLPGIVWYTWARHFWETFGLSLGLSNESHFLGTDMLWPPSFLAGILRLETSRVFTPAGWFLALAALPYVRRHYFVAAWYAAVLLYYVVSARTSGDGWAYYYHSMAVAPGSLLMAAGLHSLITHGWDKHSSSRKVDVRRRVGLLLTGLTLAGQLALGVRATQHQRERWESDLHDLYTCTRQFEPLVPPDAQIIVPGGSGFDEYGTPVAYNRPMVFAWMDRKGFSYAQEEFSLETIEQLAARGGRYWMAHKSELLSLSPEEVESKHLIMSECEKGFSLLKSK